MSGGQTVDPAELRGYSELLRRQAEHFKTIEGHAKSEGGDTSGYTGLLELLVPVVDGVVSLYSETLQFANEKMTELRENLDKAAEDYEKRDQEASSEMHRVERDVDAVGGAR